VPTRLPSCWRCGRCGRVTWCLFTCLLGRLHSAVLVGLLIAVLQALHSDCVCSGHALLIGSAGWPKLDVREVCMLHWIKSCGCRATTRPGCGLAAGTCSCTATPSPSCWRYGRCGIRVWLLVGGYRGSVYWAMHTEPNDLNCCGCCSAAPGRCGCAYLLTRTCNSKRHMQQQKAVTRVTSSFSER
jgi:hypothetical protein